MEVSNMPKLLYIGDVPVENSYHGSALLYRLLEEYPPEKLLIIESDLTVSLPERRLPTFNYKQLKVGNSRWSQTRFQAYLNSWLFFTAKNRSKQITQLIADFEPEALLTVAHGYSWITAHYWAIKHNLPLHLILHDEWIPSISILEPVRNWLYKEFAKVYCQARSRFCVSPFMEEEYRNRYGMSGTVIYPSRAKNIISPEKPVCQTHEDEKALTIVYGGTINTKGYVRTLKDLAKSLEKLNGKLIIYGNLTQERANKIGLDKPNVLIGGLLPAKKFISHIRKEADVLFLPMSFEQKYKDNMQLSFPSKLTDYTTIGLPLLIYGPPYCSAVRWARENLGVAEIVEEENLDLLTNALENLVSVKHRIALAKQSIESGNQYFSHATAYKTFSENLVSYSGR